MGEGQVEDGEEEITREIIRRKLIVALASLCVVAVAIAIQDTSSQESDDECSSYYSSVVSPDKSYKDHEPASRSDDTYYMRMQRVHLWRDSVAKGITSSSHSLPLKRKMSASHDDDGNWARLPPQSSPSPSKPSKWPCTTSRPSGYMCSACNVPFLSQQSLHQHACMPHAHEACQAAVASVSI
ncbi:hypothetical protein F5141DRAFT_1087642 [Pisolithus sp. B1]|nr:hypothetical protein F5141DRAFT_1087642 [Pisolithus sp. B1]